MQSFWANEVNIPYKDYKKLYMEGKCKLGIPNDVADEISRMEGVLPKGSGTGYAFSFFNLVGFGCIGYSLYLSFTWAWWAFIPGSFVAGFIFNVNKTSNAENVLNDALHNEEFYEKLRHLQTLTYLLDESVAQKYRVNK